MGKVITLNPFDPASINAALQEVLDYKDEFQKKVDELRQLIGSRIAWSASSGFRVAMVDDIIYGPKTSYQPVNDVTVDVRDDGNVTVVFAEGTQALFIEFGAGVSNNGAVGTSPNPWGAELGFTIGSYGKGMGARNVWAFKKGGQKVLTRGTPAAMPMYRGMEKAISVMQDLVREVFG